MNDNDATPPSSPAGKPQAGQAINFQFWVPLLISIVAIGFTAANFWETFFPHRDIFLMIARPRGGTTGGEISPHQMFNLPVIITNAGNRDEIISCICIAVSPSAPPNSLYESSLLGPYILKIGDALAFPLNLSFQRIQSISTGDIKDIYVHIVTVSPENNIIGVDIPVSRVSFSQTGGQNKYAEQGRTGYNEGLINIFSAPRS